MGCGMSTSSTTSGSSPHSGQFQRQTNVETFQYNQIGNRPTETMIEAYHRLDDEILSIENSSPGARLTTAEAWVEHLETMHLSVDDNVSVLINDSSDSVNDDLDESVLVDTKKGISAVSREKSDIVKLAVKLKVATDVKKASDQEEFLARISRGLMQAETDKLKNDMLEVARNRVAILIDSFNNLRELYAEQDNLIASISGGTYNSSIEQDLDQELEMAREIRDRLSGVSEQWRTAGNLLRASAKAALQAFGFWTLVGPSTNPSERIQLALDTRTACHSSLVALESANSALPQVEIPFITLRQSSAVKHALIYILTDMANESRYMHTKNVMESYQTNTGKAVEWLHITYKKSLEEDLTSQIDTINTLAKRLRKERNKHFLDLVGQRPYVRPEIYIPL